MTELKALWRNLWRNRASSLIAIVMMRTAIAVAATTFALADAALLRELPSNSYRMREHADLWQKPRSGSPESRLFPGELSAGAAAQP